MKTIAVINQKGGVGKTTIVVNVAGALNRFITDNKLNMRLLVIDADPQGNTTDTLLGTIEANQPTLARLFETEIYTGLDVIYKTRFEAIDIIPSNILLSNKEFFAATIIDGHRRVKNFLDLIKGQYELCLIDCPPSLGLFSLNALNASDYALIPTVPERYSILGIKDLLHTISVMKSFNSNLTVMGIVPTIVDRRYRLHNDILAELKENFPELLLDKLTISTNSVLKNSAALNKTVFEYNYHPKVYKQFMNLAKWIMEVTNVQTTST